MSRLSCTNKYITHDTRSFGCYSVRIAGDNEVRPFSRQDQTAYQPTKDTTRLGMHV